jgi:hypothetical protein
MHHHSMAKRSKARFLAGVLAQVSDSQLETLEILGDVDQMTHLMTSLLEVRSGQVVSLEHAFSDL